MRSPRTPTLLAAIVTAVAAGFFLSAMDAIGKHLSESLNIVESVWARYFFHTVIVGLVLYRKSGTAFLRTSRPGLQVSRATALFVATLFMYKSVTLVSLADATAIQFLAPVLVTLWSALFLGEKLGVHRIFAVLVGFAGVTVIASPGRDFLKPELILPLCCALCISVYFILTRMLADSDDRECTQFSTTAVGAIVLSFVLPFNFEMPGTEDAFLMIAIGSLGALGHYLLIRAFAFAPASLLSPFLYSQVVGATIISVLWFRDPVSLNMAIGTVMLVASGLYIWWRENRNRPELAHLAD